ncbi:T9SS type A sorting domain-containing protein [Candidatus Neomarinimicrobiota bacterium]
MRIGAAIVLSCILLSVHLDGQIHERQPIKCGWGSHPELLRARIPTLLGRPERQAQYITPSRTFAVHYDTSGVHAPDMTSTQVDGVPDWVVEVATALDSARSLLLVLGFDTAPADNDSIYDVYLVNYDYEPEQYFGQTMPEIDLGEYGWTSYMKIDNDFSQEEGYPTVGIDAARITVAHEYFHAVQLGYHYIESDVYFFELSSVWFEDIAYPEVNDWVNYYPRFGTNPTLNIAQTDGYSIAIFGHYLSWLSNDLQMSSETEILLWAWRAFRSNSAATAIDYSLGLYGSNLISAWTDFITRLFANGRDPDHYFYADQDLLNTPDPGIPEIMTGNLRLPFYYLRPGTAGIQVLEIIEPANLHLQVQSTPENYRGRIMIDSGEDNLTLSDLTSFPLHATGLSSISRVFVVVGGDRDSVVVSVTATDTLTNLAFSLDYIAPNPLVISKATHQDLKLGYTIGEALPLGDHRIVIYNLLGQELFRRRIERTVGEGSQTLELSTLPFATWPTGVYILSLTVGQRYTFTRTFTLLR